MTKVVLTVEINAEDERDLAFWESTLAHTGLRLTEIFQSWEETHPKKRGVFRYMTAEISHPKIVDKVDKVDKARSEAIADEVTAVGRRK